MLQMYTLAVAGPNGVELYQMEIADNFKMVTANSLHIAYSLQIQTI